MGIMERMMDCFALEKEDPDFGAMEYRGGAPVVPPQEYDNTQEQEKAGRSGDVPGAFQGRSEAFQERSEAFQGRSEDVLERSRGLRGVFRSWRRPVPKDRIDAMWWAKSARNVVWRGSEPLRILLFAGGAVALLAVVYNMRPAREVATAAIALGGTFLVGDPFRVIRRRFAIQSRILAAVFLTFLTVALWVPELPMFAATGVLGIIVVLMVMACNTEWLVETTYMASASIYDAMRRDPKGSAMKSWDAGGAREAMTFCSEFGSFVTSPYIYRMLQGVFIIAYLRGRSYEGEEEREVDEDGRVLAGATQEDYDEAMEQCDLLQEEQEEEREKWEDEMQKLYDELGEAKSTKAADERKKRVLLNSYDRAVEERDAAAAEADGLRARNDELEASCRELRENNAEMATELAGLRGRVAEMEIREREDADAVRLGRIRKEYDAGNRSARRIAQVTGYPQTSVYNIMRRWKAEEEGDMEGKTGEEQEGGGEE